MKKFFAIAVFAIIALTANAQGPVKILTYNGESFSVDYPADYTPLENSLGGDVSDWKKDDNHVLEFYTNEDYAAPSDLLDLGKTIKLLKEEDWDGNPTGWQVDEPVVDGKVMYVRCVKDNLLCWEFVVSYKDRNCFKGKLTCLLSEEKQFKPVLNCILYTSKKK